MADVPNARNVRDEARSGANDDQRTGEKLLFVFRSKKRACAEKSFQKLPVEENATRASVVQRSSGLLTFSEKVGKASKMANQGWRREKGQGSNQGCRWHGTESTLMVFRPFDHTEHLHLP